MSIPSCVVACGDVWQIRYPGAPTVCFRCGDPQHLASHCKAERRKEAVVNRWEESMGSTVEVFFPTKLREGMTEEAFLQEQNRNVRRGVLFGVRTNIQEAERDTLLEVEKKDKIITDLESKIKSVECNSITNQKELQKKESVIKDLNTKIKTMNDKNLKDHENFKTKENDYRKKVKDFVAAKEKEVSSLKNKCQEYELLLDTSKSPEVISPTSMDVDENSVKDVKSKEELKEQINKDKLLKDKETTGNGIVQGPGVGAGGREGAVGGKGAGDREEAGGGEAAVGGKGAGAGEGAVGGKGAGAEAESSAGNTVKDVEAEEKLTREKRKAAPQGCDSEGRNVKKKDEVNQVKKVDKPTDSIAKSIEQGKL